MVAICGEYLNAVFAYWPYFYLRNFKVMLHSIVSCTWMETHTIVRFNFATIFFTYKE